MPRPGRLAVALLLAGLLSSAPAGAGAALVGGTSEGGDPSPSEADLRPGIAIRPERAPAPGIQAGGCTANFVFRDAADGTLYLGTAAHCVSDASRVTLTADGGYAADVAWRGDLLGTDFALLEVGEADRGQVHPKVLHWGGPAGRAGDVEAGDHLLAYGRSAQRGGLDETSPLEGYALEPCRQQVHARLPGAGGGDSGAPVLAHDGSAVGILTGATTGSCGDRLRVREVRVLPLGTALAAGERGLDTDLELATWTQARDGLLPASLRLG